MPPIVLTSVLQFPPCELGRYKRFDALEPRHQTCYQSTSQSKGLQLN